MRTRVNAVANQFTKHVSFDMSAEAPAALHPVTTAHSEQNGDVPGVTAKRRGEPPLKSKILIALAIQVCPAMCD